MRRVSVRDSPNGVMRKCLDDDARRREDVKSVLLNLLELVMEKAGAVEPVG